ncbi:MAG: ferredoxin family protein [Bacillota bacterium]|jgi:ferredoxin like protein
MVENKWARKVSRIEEYSRTIANLNETKINIQNKINTILFKTDRESHIKIDQNMCQNCAEKPCLTVCPAGMFSLSGDGREVIYSHEGCLECGTCYVVCKHLEWNYPKGGFGVVYRES